MLLLLLMVLVGLLGCVVLGEFIDVGGYVLVFYVMVVVGLIVVVLMILEWIW